MGIVSYIYDFNLLVSFPYFFKLKSFMFLYTKRDAIDKLSKKTFLISVYRHKLFEKV
jgi:hypothetical protein